MIQHDTVSAVKRIRRNSFGFLTGKTTVLASAITMFVVVGGCQTAPQPTSETPANTLVAQGSAAAPYSKQHIYSETADPRADIAAALKQATREHKRVILDFGGDWCPDCQVLDIYLHQSPNSELLAKNFLLVHVFIGQMDKNLELASKYGVPIERGVPALAVVDGNGKVLYSQNTGQFNNMRRMDVQSVTDFLTKWKA